VWNDAVPRAVVRKRRRLRTLIITVITIAGLFAVGSGAQLIAEQVDMSHFPPPGELVDVGGGRLMHFDVRGKGNLGPTIVLEAGGTLTSSVWAWVQARLATDATVVSYDRANMGWSDPVDRPADALAVAADLHAGLGALHLHGPYLLVGHSIGAYYVQEFATAYPRDVAGLVLLDPSPSGWMTGLPRKMVESIQGQQGQTGLLRLATFFGVTRLYNPLATIVDGLPEPARSAMLASTTNSNNLIGVDRDSAMFEQLGAATVRFQGLGSLPVKIVSAGVSDDPAYASWRDAQWAMHKKMLGMSSDANQIMMPKANHISLLTQKDHADAVADVILALHGVLATRYATPSK
jgi:pimeloyl-ACP methyl ester carboxylesterase